MKIFLSYASEHRATAERINLALNSEGHDVFFDRADLPVAQGYDARIRRAIQASDKENPGIVRFEPGKAAVSLEFQVRR